MARHKDFDHPCKRDQSAKLTTTHFTYYQRKDLQLPATKVWIFIDVDSIKDVPTLVKLHNAAIGLVWFSVTLSIDTILNTLGENIPQMSQNTLQLLLR